MASKGASLIAKWRFAQKIFRLLKQFQEMQPLVAQRYDALDQIYILLDQFEQAEAEKGTDGPDNHPTEGVR